MTGPSPAVVRKVAEDLDADTLRVLAPTAEVLAQPDPAGQTALHLAVRARPDDDVTAVTALLVAMRADLGLRNSRGETPLLLAVRAALAAGVQGDGPWLLPVRLMLEAKAAACASDNQGRAALTYSAAANNLSLCRLLLDFRADPEQRNASGATARSVASRQGHQHVVELLAQAARPVPPEAKPSGKPQTANRVPNPPQLSPLERLREECRRAQIPIDWCSTEEQLRELKGRWQHLSCLSMQQLVQEAKMQRINTQGASKPEELRKRLVQQHCWEMMTDQELQQCCFAQGVLFPKNCFNTQFAANREADRLDIITRLKEATFGLRPGEFGPLPVDPKNAAQPRGSTGFRPPPRPKARSPPRPAQEHKEEEAEAPNPDTGDRRTAAGPRVRRLLEEFPGFCGEMPGLEAETWSEQELKQYFYSNGYIRPKRRQVHQPAREEASVRQHLATLGLKAPATAEAVKRAFRSLALKYHPDKRPDDQTRSADFQRIKDAYDALTAAGLA